MIMSDSAQPQAHSTGHMGHPQAIPPINKRRTIAVRETRSWGGLPLNFKRRTAPLSS